MAIDRAHRGESLVRGIAAIVGKRHVLTSPSAQTRYVTGYRYGNGNAVAVVRPGSLLELWDVLQVCVAANVAVIAQAANTGLTGGSTPFGDGYDRGLIVVNTMRIKGHHWLDKGRQIVALPGVTLDELEKTLKPLGREPHSVIGSSCLGASVIGGVCNNSGGSLIKRGPAYTQMALFARLTADGTLQLVNHLGLRLGNDLRSSLERLQNGEFTDADVEQNSNLAASDQDYASHVRRIDEPTPARFNADTRRLFEASGSAGKVIVFAVRLDTFAAEPDQTVFYLGTNNPDQFTSLRRHVLKHFAELPIAAEYIHRDAFQIAERYGKDTYLLVKGLGTGRLPKLFALKARVDAWAARFGIKGFSDRVLQTLSSILPSHLPSRIRDFGSRYEHSLMIKVAGNTKGELAALLESTFRSEESNYFECTFEEGSAAFLHRFATAGAAIRYATVHQHGVGGLVALDIALPRNTTEWQEALPQDLSRRILKPLYYGHFFCHVFHQDYLIAPGEDWLEVEHDLLDLLRARGAQYPAEHNFGHLYAAPPEVRAHYQSLDPCNCFNPGVGQTSKHHHWATDTVATTSHH